MSQEPAEHLDLLIHAPARLRILTSLAALRAGDVLSFTLLQDTVGLTAGNLITHLRKLEYAGLIDSEKTGVGGASRTSLSLSPKGRNALQTYIKALRTILDRADSSNL